MLADGQADFVIDLTDDMSQAENYGYKLTDSYLSAEFSWVLLRRHNGTLNNVAVAYDFSPSSLEMPGLGDTAHVEYLLSLIHILIHSFFVSRSRLETAAVISPLRNALDSSSSVS